MYHRIDAVDSDPWGICVEPAVFEEQIAYVSGRYPVISVAEAVHRITSENIGEQSICITFDDGYADNHLHAKPILEKYNCPATFFIPTAFIGSRKPFWWDELEYIFLHDADIESKQWKWYQTPPSEACAIFFQQWKSLQPQPEAAIQETLSELRSSMGITLPKSFRSPMTRDQLRDLFSNSLFTAGLHTHTHPNLATRTKAGQTAEIKQGMDLLSGVYNIDTPCLAYPYGSYNEDTITAAYELNLKACFTTEAISLDENSHLFTLGRYQVDNWALDEFKNKLCL